MGSVGRAVERRTVNRGDGVSIPPTAVSKLWQFRSPHICLCLSEETLKAGGPLSISGVYARGSEGQVWAVWMKPPETIYAYGISLKGYLIIVTSARK